MFIRDALDDLVPFLQFEKREKFDTASITPPWVFFTFFKTLKMVANRTKRQYDCVSSFA